VRTRLLSFGFILTLGFLLLVSLTISTGLANLRERFAERMQHSWGSSACSPPCSSIFLFGAEFTACLAGHHEKRPG